MQLSTCVQESAANYKVKCTVTVIPVIPVTVIPALPQMPGPAVAGVDIAGVAAMHIGKGAAQSVRIGRHHDHVDVVGHQAIAPHLRAAPLGRLRQKIAVERVVRLLEKRLRPPIAALGHVVGDAGEDKTGKASHPRSMG